MTSATPEPQNATKGDTKPAVSSAENTPETKNHKRLLISIPDALPSTATAPSTQQPPKADPAAEPKSILDEVELTTSLLTQLLPAQNVGSAESLQMPSLTATPVGPLLPGPSVINKQLLSKLNKLLKEKQKVIGQKENKNAKLIQDILTTSPQLSVFPVNTGTQNEQNTLATLAESTTDEPNDEKPAVPKEDTRAKAKNKRIAKQNSTRADFFAAKLASAVDDVELSDSDETFVYENNANEFDSENNSAATNAVSSGINSNSANMSSGNSAVNASAVGSAPAIPEKVSSTVAVPNVENINQAPTSIHLVNDNISVAGSIRNATPLESVVNSPGAEARIKEDDHPAPPVMPNSINRAESIHSLQSSKWNLRNTFTSNTTPPTTTSGRPNLENPALFNPYIDQQTPRDAHGRSARRKCSSHSLLSDDRSHLQRSPVLQYSESNQNLATHLSSFGTSIHLPHQQTMGENFNDGNYSFDEQDLSGEEGSSQSDLNLVCTENANNTITEPAAASVSKPADEIYRHSKAKKSKSSVTSSKLRSTTSKLFDKKGAQPRRYSTIPDDIDIEDFDDELIYYDNTYNRFPYNSQNGSTMNDSTSLLHGPKLSHYRSLNLNPNGKKSMPAPKTKRYLSLGYVQPRTQSKSNNNIFPFPYPEPHQNGYYDFDEYDEDAMEGPDEARSKGLLQGRGRLSPSNTRFLLPRKVSQDNFSSNKMKFVKSFVYTLISIICILAIGFVLGFLLASTKDLSNVSIVSIENALVTQDELIFSIVVEALNPGWFTVDIEDIELDVFAKSGYLEGPGTESSVETVLLGSVTAFESAISFEGGFFQRNLVQQIGEIKLLAPGKNLTSSAMVTRRVRGVKIAQDEDQPKEPLPPDNSEKWAVISKHPFDLILRGVLKYDLPMTSNTKSVVVNKVGYIDPSNSN